MRCFSLTLSALLLTVATGLSPAAETCDNGLPGVSFGIVCCSLGCGTCGGEDCYDRADGLTGDDCCLDDIFRNNVACNDSKAAPCIGGVSIDPEATVVPTAMPTVVDYAPEATVAPTAGETAAETVAGTAGETMATQTCDNGLPGVSKGFICCSLGCGECGGEDCSDRADGLTGDDCCIQDIERNAVLCADSMAAPCIGGVSIDPEATVAPTAMPTVVDYVPEATVAPTAGETAAETVAGTAGETMATQTCDNGLPGVSKGFICCSLGCGECGGEDCSDRADGLTGDDCCIQDIERNDVLCADSMAAPCIGGVPVDPEATIAPTVAETAVETVPEATVAPTAGETAVQTAVGTAGETMATQTCDNGLPGVSKGFICCSSGCGECGGEDCSDRADGLTGDDCCIQDIERNAVLCADSMAAPCIGDISVDPEPTVAPTMEETAGETAEMTMAAQTCSNGLPGVSFGVICCTLGCGECGGDNCTDRVDGLTGDDCCIADIFRNGIACAHSGAAPCIDLDPTVPESTVAPSAGETAGQTTEGGEFVCTGDAGILEGDICCEASCGTCGGAGCSGRGNGQSSCCIISIREDDERCSEKGAAPCVLDEDSSLDE